MRLCALFLLPLFSLLPLLSATTPPPPLSTATVYHLPPSTSTPTPLPLATLAYHPKHPDLSTILSYTPPPCSNSSSKALARIAIILPTSDPSAEPRYRISLTSLASLHPPFHGRFQLTVGRDGEVLGASWHAGFVVGDTKTKKKKIEGDGPKGEFELLVAKEGPKVVLDRAVRKGGLGAKGAGAAGQQGEEGEEVVEKTLLQK
jgi:hypothetical protein